VLNWTIFLTTCVVLGDSIALRREGVDSPNHQELIIVLLFAASFAVVVFSEFDLRRVLVEQRQEIAASTLGRLQNLAHLVAANDTARASREIRHLRETFPTWGLLIELEAHLQMLDGHGQEALRQVEGLIATGDDVYLSPVVGAACCLQQSNLDGALDLLARIRRRDQHIRHLPRLYRALEVAAGHIPALMAPVHHGPATGQVPRSTAQTLIGQEIERRHGAVHEIALDLDPAREPETAPVMAALVRWEADGTPADFQDVPALSLLLGIVLGSEHLPPDVSSLSAYAAHCRDPSTLESFGLVSLALGAPRDALKHFESAIRLAPASVRSHWGRAVACYRVGWSDAASVSLRRVETLSEDASLLSMTRRLLDGQELGVDTSHIAYSFPRGVTDMTGFELALLGLDVRRPESSGIRGQFAAALVSHALASAQQ
jgi:tetratricopeptide (TPR) repeat protein